MKRFLTLLSFLLFVPLLFAQERTISGKVIDADTGDPLPGVSIVIDGTNKGIITDLDGNYSITVADGESLVYSFVGYISETRLIEGQTSIDVSLIPDLLSLDEIVVIGYGTQKKSLVTGAISKVEGENLNKNQARVEQALQGKISGVNIMQESGAPGAGLSVRIRGTGTNKNANPLFIVDGMRTGGIEYLNANDIESVEVLKDAASAAIYGAEAANGVILITTKRGASNQASEINYNFNYGWQQPGKTAEVMNAKQYAAYYRDGLTHEIRSQYEGIEIPDDLLNRVVDRAYPFHPDTLGAGTDWMDEIFQTAPMVEHNLSISGGNETTSVFASGSFFNQDGIVGGEKSNFKRYTARLNVDHKVNSWFSMGANVSFTHLERQEIDENNEFGGVISNAMNLDPLTPVYVADSSDLPEKYKQQIYDNVPNLENSSLRAPDGKGYYGMSELVQNETRNPRAQLDNKHSVWTTDKLLGGVNARITPIEGLTLKTDYSIDLAMGNNKYWTPVYYYHSINYNYLSSTGHDNERWFTWQWENTATYTKQFGAHNIMVMAGTTARDYSYTILTGFGEGLQEESWNFAVLDAVLSDSTKAAAKGGNRNQDNRLLSYFGRAQYNYQEKYMLDVTLRSDASSKLSKANRTQYFPSASFGWVVSNEGFWSSSVINFLKLRASWGVNGSIQSLSNFEYVSTIKTDAESSYYLSGGTRLAGSEPTALSNPDLVWESSQQTDIGIDIRFFQNRLSFTADYYTKKTIDLITSAAIPEYAGNHKPNANAGDITNTGIEFELIYKDVAGDFSYSVGANAAYNNNKVTSLASPLLGENLGTTGAITYAEEGQPVWYFYGYKTDGIFNSFDEIKAYTNEAGDMIQPLAIPGDVKFQDINGDGQINEDDKTNIGSPHPDWIFGLNLDLNYKGFDLALYINGTLGNDVYYGAYRSDLTNNNKPLYFYEEAWTPDNHSDFPRYTVTDNNNNFSHNDLFVFDGSYLRLQNLELGYTLPHDMSEKIKIKRLRVYASARNLFVLTSYPGSDPEIGNSAGNDDKRSIGVDRGLFPKSKVYSFGINLTL